MVKVRWQSTAKEDLRAICHYYRHVKLSLVTVTKIKEAMFAAARSLEMFPEQGAIEICLQQSGICYRYLVVRKHYKLIYFYESKICHIVAIWDCRNNPQLLQDKINP